MKIAIIKTSALGDIIHCACILQFIKHKIPNIHITWIVEERFKGILEGNQDIDEILTINLTESKKSISKFFQEVKYIKSFKKNNYDKVIDFQGLIKSAIVSKIISPNTYGYDKKSIRESLASFFYKYSFDIPYDYNTIDRYRLLANKALDINISKDEILNHKIPYMAFSSISEDKISEFISKEKKNVIFIIGSTWKSRIYPKEKLEYIAKNFDANILIPYGNEEEKQNALAIKSANIIVLPKLNIDDLKAVISKCDLLIGNDTGPSYIAWANNIPSITIFGPTPPTRIYESNIHKIIKSNSQVNPYKLNKNDFSICDIDAEDVLNLAKDLLS